MLYYNQSKGRHPGDKKETSKREENKMAKVTIETAMTIQNANHALGYDPVEYDGAKYVQIDNMDTIGSDKFAEPCWEGYAVKIGDDIDEDYNTAPLYKLIWYLDNPDAEDGQDTVNDWDKVDDVYDNMGGVEITTGRII